jgi:signal transduction histidine kinase
VRSPSAAEGRHIANVPAPTHSRGRPWSWITGRPRLVDGLLVAITLVPAFIGTIAIDYFRVSTPLFIASLVLVFFKSVPLWWRRTQPVAVLVIVAGALLAGDLLGLSQPASDGGIIFAAYAVSVYGSSTARLWVVTLAALGTLVAFITALTGANPRHESLLTLGPPSLVAWVIGDYIRGRRAFFTDLLARHGRESETLRRQAVEEERLRIARELHDVVAHNVSVIAIQAGATRVAGNAELSNPKALLSIETTARDTLAELNRLLGVLRKESSEPNMSPQPSLEQLDALLKTASEAGLEVDLRITGDQRPLPAALGLTAYRIVQEAITNALKHAHATKLEVRVGYLPDALELTISDNGGGVSEEAVMASIGHGLIGMRERVALFGGELEAGSHDLGGFTVRSRLPLNS